MRDDLRYAVAQVARSVMPSVVHIEASQQRALASALDFTKGPATGNSEDSGGKFKSEVTALASGIIMDTSGHIVTNHHVIEDASSITVILADARRYPARLVGTDPATDLAVLRIEPASPLTPAVFGDSDRVEVGEWVVAIGHPRGLDQTVTQGIISAKNRRGILDPSSYQDFLQTDAAINPGNSGGPLINLKGEVIGINSVIASESGGFEGIGFAIPSNLAMSVARSIVTHGKVMRGWIGLVVADMDARRSAELGLTTVRGAVAVDVVKGGPAFESGIRAGDVILKCDGETVEDAGMLRNIVSRGDIGKELLLEVDRSGTTMELKVTIADIDSSIKYLTATVRERLGVETRDVRPHEKDAYGIDTGVTVTWLDTTGPMAMAGFEVGDIILEVDGRMIRGTHDFASIAAMVQPQQETILMALDHRSGLSAYVQVKAR
ncbi:MAG TPA: trypsin-like peptidase domain-containing protein [Deltaproteobacteria bacterium]|nr:trypsin-like peptidase domain-containing protein [Deltaproteobacteria bacterium]